MWMDPADNEANIAWVRGLRGRPAALFGARWLHQLHGWRRSPRIADELRDELRAAGGDQSASTIPQNLFHVNQNIARHNRDSLAPIPFLSERRTALEENAEEPRRHPKACTERYFHIAEPDRPDLPVFETMVG